MRPLSIPLLAVLVAGCRTGEVEPHPLAGPPPRKVLVWPGVGAAHAPLQPLLLGGLDAAVQGRGYEVVTSAVAARLFADVDPADGDLRAATGADAVLRLVVHEFALRGERAHGADWDLEWQLVAAGDGAPLWHHRHRGHWERRAAVDAHPHPRDDMDVAPVWLGDPSRAFRDASDLVAWLHRQALARLPRGRG